MILFCARPVSLNLSVDIYTHFDGVALHPRLLRSVRYSSLSWKVHERIGTLRDIVHLPEQRHEQRSLARPGWPDDEVDLAALEELCILTRLSAHQQLRDTMLERRYTKET